MKPAQYWSEMERSGNLPGKCVFNWRRVGQSRGDVHGSACRPEAVQHAQRMRLRVETRACASEFVDVRAGSCRCCRCLWNLFFKHSSAPNIKQESKTRVGVQRYKEHKECHRLKLGRQIFFSASKAQAKRCHESMWLEACNLKYYW